MYGPLESFTGTVTPTEARKGAEGARGQRVGERRRAVEEVLRNFTGRVPLAQHAHHAEAVHLDLRKIHGRHDVPELERLGGEAWRVMAPARSAPALFFSRAPSENCFFKTT